VLGILVAGRAETKAFAHNHCEFLGQLSEHVRLAAHQIQLHQNLGQAYEHLRRTQELAMEPDRLRALGQMASGIAQDINNAISPASLYTEYLVEREANLSSHARGYRRTIQRAVSDVAQTVARMREFYRPREPEAVLVPVALNRLLTEVAELTRARGGDISQQRGVTIQLHTEFNDDLPSVLGAKNEIRDAIINLILNAVDAMPSGGTIKLRTFATRNVLAPRVCLEVSDTGFGMDPETRRGCLEPFFITKGERDTGCGLAMVYELAERHHAEIEIAREPGKGTGQGNWRKIDLPSPSGSGCSGQARCA
jgi:signal transduction histidine kinase